MTKIEFSPASLQDLLGIQKYLILNYGEEASNATLEKILKQTDDIKRTHLLE